MRRMFLKSVKVVLCLISMFWFTPFQLVEVCPDDSQPWMGKILCSCFGLWEEKQKLIARYFICDKQENNSLAQLSTLTADQLWAWFWGWWCWWTPKLLLLHLMCGVSHEFDWMLLIWMAGFEWFGNFYWVIGLTWTLWWIIRKWCGLQRMQYDLLTSKKIWLKLSNMFSSILSHFTKTRIYRTSLAY